MNVLLVQPLTPATYWGFQHSLPLAGRVASLPPLGLASLAALLPERWTLRIADLNVAPLADRELRWADVVLVTGMLIHQESMRQVLLRARALGRRTVVGGPAATTSPDAFPEADHVFQGEAERRLDGLVAALESPGSSAPRVLSPSSGDRPPMSAVPPPRFDLLDGRAYVSMSVQYSRGCPFQCEFCDIIEVFGRVPRTKSPEQVIAELAAVLATGYRGTLFFVDDNFIGNRRAVAELLPRIEAWQEAHDWPFELYTEASLDLASRPELVAAMVKAGFSAVFLGIETPSGDALREAKKHQNLRMTPLEAVEVLTRAGLECYSGFIVGFDSDGPEIFDEQLALISASPVAMAMIGILTALPGTALTRRLEREGRMRESSCGDTNVVPNFETTLGDEVLVEGYRGLIAEVYSADGFYARAERLITMIGQPPRAGARPGGMATLARTAWHVGVISPRRGHFWRLVGKALARSHRHVARAIALAVMGEHLIRFTEEDVIPRLDRALAEIRARGEAEVVPMRAMRRPASEPLPAGSSVVAATV